MMTLWRDDWNLRQWHTFLYRQLDLVVGRDYQWAWDHETNRWAIEFHDVANETLVRLKVC